MSAHGAYRKHYAIGPGGIRCPCCYPPPGPKRRKLERTFKRRERQTAYRDLRAQAMR